MKTLFHSYALADGTDWFCSLVFGSSEVDSGVESAITGISVAAFVGVETGTLETGTVL